MRVRPLPPYSVGHEAQIQPPSNSLAVHSRRKALRSSGVIENPGRTPSVGQVVGQPRADLGPERLGIGRIGEVHGPEIIPGTARNGTERRGRPARACLPDAEMDGVYAGLR